ncbi:MAG: GIY-YIG nuclease family protein [Candidatus Gastranaerophilaceae bacterium]
MAEKHFVYILQTERGTLYCGYTDDVERRFNAHKTGHGAKYTKANKPVKLLWQKSFDTKSEALKEEYRIKHKLTRQQKFELIQSD